MTSEERERMKWLSERRVKATVKLLRSGAPY
jgi:hypothetical protein